MTKHSFPYLFIVVLIHRVFLNLPLFLQRQRLLLPGARSCTCLCSTRFAGGWKHSRSSSCGNGHAAIVTSACTCTFLEALWNLLAYQTKPSGWSGRATLQLFHSSEFSIKLYFLYFPQCWDMHTRSLDKSDGWMAVKILALLLVQCQISPSLLASQWVRMCLMSQENQRGCISAVLLTDPGLDWSQHHLWCQLQQSQTRLQLLKCQVPVESRPAKVQVVHPCMILPPKPQERSAYIVI